jgi:hypothetical protein
MKYLISAIILGVFAAAGAPAVAQSRGASMMIQMLDMDGDARVDVDEWIEASYPPLAFFGAFIKLTLADYQETLTGTSEDTEKAAKANFVKFDANKDGFLTGPEFRETFAADFASMDKDKDGNLTVEEYEAAQGKREEHAH